jgi:type IV secretory pathway VirB10-like protein
MATPDRDVYTTTDGTNRTVYTRENNSTAWFIGIVVALALLAIAYLVFSANSQPSSTTINNTPAVTTTIPAAPADTTTAPDTNATPMAPATPAATAPATTAPAATAPATTSPSADVSTAPSAALAPSVAQ